MQTIYKTICLAYKIDIIYEMVRLILTYLNCRILLLIKYSNISYYSINVVC